MRLFDGPKLKRLLVLMGGLLLTSAPHAPAQKLALRTYSVSDGLAHGVVMKIHQDPKGYIWVATQEGLSRYDGYRFTNYGERDGLRHIFINDVVSDRRGRLWVATNGAGVARLIDDPSELKTAGHGLSTEAPTNEGGRFVHYLIADGGSQNHANLVNRILFDSQNRLWCVTDNGLYRAKETEVSERAFELIAPGRTPLFFEASIIDSRGRLWFSVNAQVVQIGQGEVTSYTPAREADSRLSQITEVNDIHSVVEDERGRVLAVDSRNLFEFVEPDAANTRGSWQKLPLDLRQKPIIRVAYRATEGGLWIGTGEGMIHYQPGRHTVYTNANGLSSNVINALMTDREGNLWIGTGGGLCKLSRNRIISYSTEQGLPFPLVQRLVEDREGRIYATVGCGPSAIVEIAGGDVNVLHRFEVTASSLYCTGAELLQDLRGNWWVLSTRGLEFFPGPRLRLQGGQRIKILDGFRQDEAVRMSQDAEGKIWLLDVAGNLYVADVKQSARPRFQFVLGSADPALYFERTLAGIFWFGNRSAIWRVINGQRVELKATGGLPAIEPRVFFVDSRGRMWIGSRYHGVSMTTEPDAENPRFTHYTTVQGLASDSVWAIAEDNDGRIYFGTGRGLDRLDPNTGRLHHVTLDEGMVSSGVQFLLKDRQGHIWVGSHGGLSRIDPGVALGSIEAPPIFINRVQVAGEELQLPETGAQEVGLPDLSATRNNIAVQFVGLNHHDERPLHYQHMLDGVDKDWSGPTLQREVNYASLAPGHYRFLVRAVNTQGLTSEVPASLSFTILPPIWQRRWFVALAATLFGLIIYHLYRYRVARLLEVERVRTRIAADLHDDIGANLTRIAVLSEVAHRHLDGGDAELEKPLSAIARISRESVASMSDIVWAINPRRDSLHDLIQRMRRFAGEIFSSGEIEWEFHAPVDGDNIRLGADVRRDLLLIFKEAVNNAARHSGSANVAIDFRVEGAWFILNVRDDGRGFDAATATDGQGLFSMQRRARNLGAELRLQSQLGRGTEVVLKVPRRPP